MAKPQRLPYAFLKQLLVTDSFTAEHFAQLGWGVFGRVFEREPDVRLSEGLFMAIGKWLHVQQQVPMSKVFRILENLYGKYEAAINDPESVVGSSTMALVIAIADARWISWSLPPCSGVLESYQLSDLKPYVHEGETVFSSVLDVLSLKRWLMKQYDMYCLANPRENTDAAATGNKVSTAEGTS